MANFVYLVGDDEQKICMVVDPAWDIPGILEVAEHEGMRLAGALVTHYHPDHVGGNIFGHNITGLSDFISMRPLITSDGAGGIQLFSGLAGLVPSRQLWLNFHALRAREASAGAA